jgi:hypothetical protein
MELMSTAQAELSTVNVSKNGNDCLTVARIARDACTSFYHVKQVIEAKGIEPDLSLNGVGYYGQAKVMLIHLALTQAITAGFKAAIVTK